MEDCFKKIRNRKLIKSIIGEILESITKQKKRVVVLIRCFDNSKTTSPIFIRINNPSDEEELECANEALSSEYSLIFNHEIEKKWKSRSVTLDLGKKKIQVTTSGLEPEENLKFSIRFFSCISERSIQKIIQENKIEMPIM